MSQNNAGTFDTARFTRKESNMFSFLKKKTPESIEKVTQIKACISGKAIPASDINDEVFSSGMMGKGIGIIPTENTIVAPCDAEVTTVMADSKHAVGLHVNNGADILIHEGLDTVSLNGQGFRLFVKEGDKVKAGDKLIQFDPDFIKEQGLDTVCVFLLTNSEDMPNVQFTSGIEVSANHSVVMRF